MKQIESYQSYLRKNDLHAKPVKEKRLPELKHIQELAQVNHPLLQTYVLETIQYKEYEYPIVAFVLGSRDKTKPTFGLFGGVHGLERIGTQVIISYLNHTLYQASWDKDLQEFFNHCRLVSVPLINPTGMASGTRSNYRGVDLMRNAPVDADEATHWPVSGHRLTKLLPWYRGRKNDPMEKEAQSVADFIQREMFEAPLAISLDIHSGFGMKDRLWYPYARTKAPFPKVNAVTSLKMLFENTLPHHVYQIEPQSNVYTTHGDLWDYLFDLHVEKYQDSRLFLPWTLEMGSWLWVRKNPIQLLSLFGLFNPMKPHRFGRVMRRHFLLLDFLLRASRSYHAWLP